MNVSAAGWTPLTKIESFGTYGVDTFMVKTAQVVSQCGDTKQLYWIKSSTSQHDEFYAALLTAYASGSDVKIYLHDPVNCGPQNAQKINSPNYIYVE